MTLKELAKAINDKKHPNVPLHCRPNKPLSDSSANNLTKAIIAYFDYKGIKAWRQSSEGRYIKGREYTDWAGRKKEEKGKWIPRSNAAVGIGDICALINSIFVTLEVKFGNDKQSAIQKKFQNELEASGGKYYIIHTWDEFIALMDKINANKGTTN